MILNKMCPDKQHSISFACPYCCIIFLVSLAFAIFLFSKNLSAFTGVSGKVYKYSNPSSTLSGIQVKAFEGNMEIGTATTSSTGSYSIALPAGMYRICASGTNYVTECYERGCSGPNCGFYLVADPNDIQENLVEVLNNKTTTNINFYLCRGGKIEGNINNKTEGISYDVVVEGTIKYKVKNEISVPIFNVSIADDHYTTTTRLPAGDYKVKVQDFSTNYPYYHDIYYNGRYTKEQADIIEFQLDRDESRTIDFYLQKGGIIYGYITILATGEYVAEARVSVTDQISGYSRSLRTVESYTDPNGEFVLTRGQFLISGLPPGSYIFKTDDFYFPSESRIYLDEYYNRVYYEDKATLITLSAGQERRIDGALARAPKVKGWVIEGDPAQCEQYHSNEALSGVEIVIGPYPWQLDPVTTDPNGFYLYDSLKKILPGVYKIRAKDLTNKHFASFYEGITLEPNKEYNFNFCLKKATGDTSASISGSVFMNENTNLPVPNVDIFSFDKETRSDKYTTTTDSEGKFKITIGMPESGGYILFTKKINDDKYRNLMNELFKDVPLLDSEIFPEAVQIALHITDHAEIIEIGPGEHLTGIDIGLSSYQYTFVSGLNLFGYPGIPVSKYNNSYKICAELGTNMNDFRWLDPGTGKWHMTLPNPSKPNTPLGDNISIMTGNAYMVYMDRDKGSVFYPPYKVHPPTSYLLTPGRNFIAYPSSLHRPIKRSHDLLSAIGKQSHIANVESFDNISGKWRSSVWMWGKPSGNNFPIVQGSGYLVGMRIAKEFTPQN